jgi:hypothetical protein
MNLKFPLKTLLTLLGPLCEHYGMEVAYVASQQASRRS